MSNHRRRRDPLNRLDNLERARRHSRIRLDWEPDEAPDRIQNASITFKVREKKTKLEFKAFVDFDPVPLTSCMADIDHWEVQLQPTNAEGVPKDEGRRRREYVFAEDLDDPDESEDLRVVFEYIPHPKHWYWRARARAVDRAGRKGKWGGGPIGGDGTPVNAGGWTNPKLPFEAALPKPPVPSGLFLDVDLNKGDRQEPRWKVIAKFDEVTPWDIPPDDNNKEDTQDKEDDVRSYDVKLARVDPTILEDAGKNRYRHIGPVRKKNVTSKQEEDDEDKMVKVVFPNERRRHYYQAKVRSVDRFGREGEWSTWSAIATGRARSYPVPKPTSIVLAIDNTKFTVDWEASEDPDDPDTDLKDLHPDVAFFQVQVSSKDFSDNNWSKSDIVRQDRYVHSMHKNFNVKKPGSGAYWARVRAVDGSNNKSAWLATNKPTYIDVPPTPGTPPRITKDKMGQTKHHKWRAIVTFDYSEENYKEDHVSHYIVALRMADKQGDLAGTDPERRERVDDDDPRRAVFSKIKPKTWVQAMFRAVGKQGQKSAWSDWSLPLQLSQSNDKPEAPKNVQGIKNKRNYGVKWDPAPDPLDPTLVDPQVSHYHAQISTSRFFTSIHDEDKEIIGSRASFKVPVKTKFFGRVASVDSEGNYSTWVYNTTTGIPPQSDLEGEEADLILEEDLEKDIISADILKVDAIQARHEIVGAKFMTAKGTNEARIVIKDVAGQNDRIKFFGVNGNPVGTLQADQRDMWGTGDWAFQGLQFSNNYGRHQYPERKGWARILLEEGDIWVSITGAGGSPSRHKLAYIKDIDDKITDHKHDQYALSSHNHDGRYYTKDEIDQKLGNKVNKGGGWHQHDINTGGDPNHAHGGTTGGSTVGG